MSDAPRAASPTAWLAAALLLVLVLAGVGLQQHWTRQVDLEGPHALAVAPGGGFYLATSTRLYHLDDRERVTARYPAAQLGIGRFDSLLADADGRLWVYDSESRRVMSCRLPATCTPFDAGQVAFSANATLAEGPAGEGLLLSDNRHHRLQVLDARGQVLTHPLQRGWHFPNQISPLQDAWVLADTDRRQLVKIVGDAQGRPAQREVFLRTEGRPYRFVVRPEGVWTVEAGISLNEGRLYRYRDGRRELLPTVATDVAALADIHGKLALVSRQDWRVLVSDDAGARWRSVADVGLAREFDVQRERNATLTRWSRWLPVGLGVMALGLVWWAWRSERRVGRPLFATPAALSAGMAALPLAEGARLHPRPAARRALCWAVAVYGVLPVPVLGWAMWQLLPHLADPQSQRLWFMMAGFVLLWPLCLYLAWRWGLARRFASLAFVQDERLLLLTWWDGSTRAAPYEQVWLGPRALWLDGFRVPLTVCPRLPLWERAWLVEALRQHGQSHRVFDGELALLRALWQARHGPALRWLALRVVAWGCLVAALGWRWRALGPWT